MMPIHMDIKYHNFTPRSNVSILISSNIFTEPGPHYDPRKGLENFEK